MKKSYIFDHKIREQGKTDNYYVLIGLGSTLHLVIRLFFCLHAVK